MRKRKSIVALSTTKFEYMTANHVSNEGVRLQILYSSIGFVQQDVRLCFEN
jgi:hypothetical protein